VALEAKVAGKLVQWTERRWLVQSVALAKSCQGTSILTQLGDTNCYAGDR
jgi:hypothetical protein